MSIPVIVKIAISVDSLSKTTKLLPIYRYRPRNIIGNANAIAGTAFRPFGQAFRSLRAMLNTGATVTPRWNDPGSAKIIMGRGNVRKNFLKSQTDFFGYRGLKDYHDVASLTKATSPSGNKAINSIMRAHEGYEISALKRMNKMGITPELWGSHFSPTVIAQEGSLLSTLTGKGAREGKEFMHAFRGIGTEEGKINSLMHALGYKGYKYGETRLNRHEIKMIEKLFAERLK